MNRLITALGGSGIFARAARSSVLTAGSYAFAQGLRLVANLILARLLFPEAFGIMALVTVVLVGLTLFSDIGLGPAIAQHDRGDDPLFLDTAFTLNVARGVILWILTCAVALPLSLAYSAPELAWLLPVAGVTLLIGGLTPVRVETANRHLLLGRVTALDLLSQVIGIMLMIALAFALKSVWALVFGSIAGAVSRVFLMHFFLPGRRGGFGWDRNAARDLVHFGKWIFLSTACGFLLSQGDKAIFGAYLTLSELGIYNIGYFLASFPMMLAGAITGRIMIPIYRDRHPSWSTENAAQLRRMRFLLTGGTLAILALIAAIGPWLVAALYDDRYMGAAIIVVAVALTQIAPAIGMTYDQSALAAGDSKGYFALIALKAAVQSAAFIYGIHHWGLLGALVAQGAVLALLHLAIIRLARHHKAWDAGHDVSFALIGLAIGLAVLGMHQDLIFH